MDILIVEDDKASSAYLEQGLKSEGYEVQVAENGIEALSLVRTVTPQLIISDIMMPKMDGFELCRQLKADASLKNIPLVFYTATYLEEQEKQLGLSLGASRYVEKPMKWQELLAVVQEVIAEYGSDALPVSGEPLRPEPELDALHREVLVRKLESKVSELKQIQNQLSREIRDKNRILESAGEGIFGLDRDGRHTFVNSAAARMLGYSQQELLGIKSHECWHNRRPDGSDYPEAECPIHITISTGERNYGEEYFINAEGSFFPVYFTSHPIVEEGNLIGAVVTFFDISERKQAEDKINYLAYYDNITGLANRALLAERLKQTVIINRRYRHLAALLLINIDRFKTINDALGQSLGDKLLHLVGQKLSGLLREGDTLARLSSDEFAIILPELSNEWEASSRKAHDVAQKILSVLRTPNNIEGEEILLTVSVGITIFPDKEDANTSTILSKADTALHRVKEKGGNNASFFEGDMSANVQQRFRIERELRHAISNDELRLYFQPQVDDEKKLIGFESLIRWEHTERGLVPPGTFIPIAEETNLIVDIDRWVLAESLCLMAKGDMRGEPFHVSVNISPRHFMQPGFVEWLKGQLLSSGADPNHLTLEVTENLLIENVNEVVAKMHELSTMGIRFSLDDFGTGYSSLSYLKRLPLNELKIDRSFIQDVIVDHDDAALVETIMAVAEHMHLNIVAEGVEKSEQADFLKERGKVIYQGYLYGKPEPAIACLERMFGSKFS